LKLKYTEEKLLIMPRRVTNQYFSSATKELSRNLNCLVPQKNVLLKYTCCAAAFIILTVNSVLCGYSHKLRSAVALQIIYLSGKDYTIAKRCNLGSLQYRCMSFACQNREQMKEQPVSLLDLGIRLFGS